MKKVAVILANGFEEVEAIAPIDYLRRAGAEVDIIGLDTQAPVGSHGITVTADITDKRADINAYDAVILPGGMPGAKNLDDSDFVDAILAATAKRGGILAAICAAPMVLGHKGYLKGKKATCYPGFESELIGADAVKEGVVTDGNIITAIGMGAAIAFGREITSLLCGEAEANKISAQIQENFVINKKDDSIEKLLSSLTLTKTDVYDELEENEPEAAEAKLAPALTCRTPSKYADYKLPELSLLREAETDENLPEDKEATEGANQLINVLESFNVKAEIRSIEKGPRLIRYSIFPSKGFRVSQIEKISDDIALAIAAESVRIEAPIPGKSVVGIELPRKNPVSVNIRELIESEEFQSNKSATAVCLGKAIDGSSVFADIKTMPHLLIAGATGMGKSLCMNSIITSILYKATPDEVKFILIDPKHVEFTYYSNIPHLLVPIITQSDKAAGALLWAVDEMNRRYSVLERLSLRNIDAYNEAVAKDSSLGEPMPKIIIIIDELCDLMIEKRDPIENLIMIIAQKARAAGIHLVIGTQHPSVNVITGIIKANIPSRIAFKTSSSIDSRTILEQTGAEKLIGKGDMLVSLVGSASPTRVQCTFISETETSKIVESIKSQAIGNIYDDAIISEIKKYAESVGKPKRVEEDNSDEIGDDCYLNDKKFLNAVEITLKNGSASTSFLQRKLSIGYGKAARYIDIMEDLGIITEKNGSKSRGALLTLAEWEEKLKRIKP